MPRGGAARALRRYVARAVVLDAVSALAADLLAVHVRFSGEDPAPGYGALVVLGPLVWVLAIAFQRGYERRFLGTGAPEYRRLADATLMLFVLAAVLSFSFKAQFSRGYLLAALPLVLVLTALGRRQLRSWLNRLRAQGDGAQRVVVVGHPDAVRHLVQQLAREPWHGLTAVGVCLAAPVRDGGAIEPGAVLDSVDRLGADAVVVASHPDASGQALRRLAWALEERDVDLVVSPGIAEVASPRLSIRPVAGLPLLHLEHRTMRGGRIVLKGLLDRVLALLMLLGLLPVLVVAALAVRLTSAGPVLFRQTRVGVDGRPFQMYKFRSMVVGAEQRLPELLELNDGDGVLFKMRQDPRVTPVGRFLRRFSIDELPQLVNVVRGEMSLVGPRPPLPAEVEAYSADAARRLRVRPGLTGLWQVSGRSDLSWEESLRLDLRYVDNWSLGLDLSILARTARAVLGRAGAY